MIRARLFGTVLVQEQADLGVGGSTRCPTGLGARVASPGSISTTWLLTASLTLPTLLGIMIIIGGLGVGT